MEQDDEHNNLPFHIFISLFGIPLATVGLFFGMINLGIDLPPVLFLPLILGSIIQGRLSAKGDDGKVLGFIFLWLFANAFIGAFLILLGCAAIY